MTSYNIKINDQLIDIINENNINENYLLFIYYTCCILGGYESIDYLIHLLVYNIIKYIKVDLRLYYPDEFNIEIRMKETRYNYNNYNLSEKNKIDNFIKKLGEMNNNVKNIHKPKNIHDILLKTTSLRGFNQEINYRKIYNGNVVVVKNYFINDIDIAIMINIIKKYKNEDIIKVFKIYFQSSQLMHYNKLARINREAINKKYNYNKENNMTNIMLGLINYGDCREMSLILEFYYCLKEWLKYISYVKDFTNNEYKIIKLIKNQNRIISVDIYFNAYNKNNFRYIKNYILLNNKKGDIEYNNINYNILENHYFVLKFKKYKYICKDIMYNKYNTKLIGSDYEERYIISDKKIKINKPIIDFGKNYLNKNINVIGIVKNSMFNIITYINNIELINHKFLFIFKNYNLPNNFYDINSFIESREKYFYILRKKYLKKDVIVTHYNGNTKSKNIKYFLLSDL
jgi:hypothetical protein